LKGLVDDERFGQVLAMLEYQAGQAQVWRDAVAGWFFHESGIADAKGRVGKYPGRFEAEAMRLEGYAPVDVKPWETASGGKAVACAAAKCSAGLRFDGVAGWYTLRVEYFDQINGVSKFTVAVNGQRVDAWQADLPIPTRKMDGSSSTRRTIRGVALRPGDEIRVEGIPDGGEQAGLDYIELVKE